MSMNLDLKCVFLKFNMEINLAFLFWPLRQFSCFVIAKYKIWQFMYFELISTEEGYYVSLMCTDSVNLPFFINFYSFCEKPSVI